MASPTHEFFEECERCEEDHESLHTADELEGTAHFRFMDLPLELRNRVYNFAVIRRHDYYHSCDNDVPDDRRPRLQGKPGSAVPSLLSVSKTINSEATDEATRNCTWYFQHLSSLAQFLRITDQGIRTSFRHAVVEINRAKVMKSWTTMTSMALCKLDLSSCIGPSEPIHSRRTHEWPPYFRFFFDVFDEDYGTFRVSAAKMRLSSFEIVIDSIDRIEEEDEGDEEGDEDEDEEGDEDWAEEEEEEEEEDWDEEEYEGGDKEGDEEKDEGRDMFEIAERVQNLVDWMPVGLKAGGTYTVTINGPLHQISVKYVQVNLDLVHKSTSKHMQPKHRRYKDYQGWKN